VEANANHVGEVEAAAGDGEGLVAQGEAGQLDERAGDRDGVGDVDGKHRLGDEGVEIHEEDADAGDVEIGAVETGDDEV
jgi:hypothetical protein